MEDKHEDGTYSIYSGIPVTYPAGYQVSFERKDVEIPEELYDKVVNLMVVVTSSTPHIGIFEGVKEISFHVNDLNRAIALATIFNQESIWDWKNSRLIGVK